MTVEGLKRCQGCGRLALDGETVTLGRAEFDRLLVAAKRGRLESERVDQLRQKTRSPITRDLELADYILSMPGDATLAEILAACSQRFGPGRTPSLSALSRFMIAVKGRVKARYRSAVRTGDHLK